MFVRSARIVKKKPSCYKRPAVTTLQALNSDYKHAVQKKSSRGKQDTCATSILRNVKKKPSCYKMANTATTQASNRDVQHVTSKNRLNSKHSHGDYPLAGPESLAHPTLGRQQQAARERPVSDIADMNAEGGASSDASSLLVILTSPSPSRSGSRDRGRVPVIPGNGIKSTGNTTTIPFKVKPQRVRQESNAASCGKMSAAANSDSSGVCTPHTMLHPEASSEKTQHIRNHVHGRQNVFPKDVFYQLAKKGEAMFLNDLANRRGQYPMPFIGTITCQFLGKSDDDCADIRITDSVTFRWFYTCVPKPGLEIKGATDLRLSVRQIALGKLPPRAPRNMIDSIVVAKVYEQLSFTNAPFMQHYCSKNNLDTAECEICRIGFPKLVREMPIVDDFTDEKDTSAKWIRCARIGDTDKCICHPGPSSRYSTNRLTYSVSELRVFNLVDKKEAIPETFKRRKRKAIHHKRPYPVTLDAVNSGAHRGIRDLMAYGVALAEFELAKHEGGRDISVMSAMSGFQLDPFPWEDGAPESNMVEVLWRAGDGSYHLQTGNLRYFLGLISNPAE